MCLSMYMCDQDHKKFDDMACTKNGHYIWFDLPVERTLQIMKRSSDTLNSELPIEMTGIKDTKKMIFLSGKDSWPSPQIIPQGDFQIGQVLIDNYRLKT